MKIFIALYLFISPILLLAQIDTTNDSIKKEILKIRNSTSNH